MDKENYYYVYKVHTNKWESSTFDNISEVRLVNGKTMFFAGSKLSKDVYVYNYQLYVNNKPVGDVYSSYTGLKLNGNILSFIGSRGNNMYLVNVTL
jgi:hypothetical protein